MLHLLGRNIVRERSCFIKRRRMASFPLTACTVDMVTLSIKEVPNRNLFLYLCENGCDFFREVIKLNVISASPGKVTLWVPFHANLAGNPHPKSMHGGVIAAAIDHAAGFACWSTFDESICSTLNMRIDYLKPLLCSDGGIMLDAIVEHIDEERDLMRTTVMCFNEARTKQVAVGRALFNRYSPKLGVIDKAKPLFRLMWKISYLNNFAKAFLRRYRAAHMAIHWKKFKRRQKSISIFSINDYQDKINHQDATTKFNGLTTSDFIAVAEREPIFGFKVLGLRVLSLKPGTLTTVLPFKEYFTGNFVTGACHGGVLASLVDQTAGMCARSVVENNQQRVSTVDFNIDYLAPAPIYERMFCEARVVTQNFDGYCSGIILVEASCWSESSSNLIGIAKLTFNVYNRLV